MKTNKLILLCSMSLLAIASPLAAFAEDNDDLMPLEGSVGQPSMPEMDMLEEMPEAPAAPAVTNDEASTKDEGNTTDKPKDSTDKVNDKGASNMPVQGVSETHGGDKVDESTTPTLDDLGLEEDLEMPESTPTKPQM